MIVNRKIQKLLDPTEFKSIIYTHDVLLWLRSKNVYITALPYRDVEENQKEVTFFYSIVDLADFDNGEDIAFDEDSLGTSTEEFSTYDEAIEKAIEVYLTVTKRMGG